MSIVRVSPLAVQVRTDWLRGLPRSIRLAGEELAVLAVTRVRQERAAYPVSRGPRTCFEVETAAARFALTYTHRDRRWILDGLDRASSAPSSGQPASTGQEALARAA